MPLTTKCEPDSSKTPQQHFGLQPPASSSDRNKGLSIGGKPVVSIGHDVESFEDKGSSQFFTDCKKEYLASINCRLDHHDHKDTNICQPLFDNYNACRKEENARRIEENKNKSFW